jgi:DNA-binding response OmpR family regulator
MLSALLPDTVVEAGPLVLRPDGQVRVHGRRVLFTVRELGLVLALVRRRGEVVSRADLYAEAWDRELRPGDRSVDVYVRRVRSKLREASPETAFIHTHLGFGYRLEPTSQDLHDVVTNA